MTPEEVVIEAERQNKLRVEKDIYPTNHYVKINVDEVLVGASGHKPYTAPGCVLRIHSKHFDGEDWSYKVTALSLESARIAIDTMEPWKLAYVLMEVKQSQIIAIEQPVIEEPVDTNADLHTAWQKPVTE